MKPSLLENRGVPLDKQKFTWRDLVQKPISKLDDDAYTRVRIILMNGIELEAHRFSHSAARMNKALQLPLAQIRRVEQHQATMINWLIGADHSPLETTIAYEQVAIDVTAAVAMNEPDDYLAQVYRFGLLEDFDHMYRCSTGWRARMPTTSCRAIPTSCRGGRRWTSIARRRTICAAPTTARARRRFPSCTRSPSWRPSSRRTIST
jgi:hypothetical protein